MANILDQIKSAYGDMPTSKRIIIGASVALTIALLVFSAWYGSRPEYVSLYPNLGREDTAKVLSELRTKGIPYEVSNTPGGNTMIQVPREKVARLRMQFAEQGIPSASVVEGWSIVDNEGFGISESKHRLNKLRALQGELARTIAENQKVVGARVHLAIPDRRTLRSDRRLRGHRRFRESAGEDLLERHVCSIGVCRGDQHQARDSRRRRGAFGRRHFFSAKVHSAHAR